MSEFIMLPLDPEDTPGPEFHSAFATSALTDQDSTPKGPFPSSPSENSIVQAIFEAQGPSKIPVEEPEEAPPPPREFLTPQQPPSLREVELSLLATTILNGLTGSHRAVLTLEYFYGLTTSEIATELGLKNTTQVKCLSRQARHSARVIARMFDIHPDSLA